MGQIGSGFGLIFLKFWSGLSPDFTFLSPENKVEALEEEEDLHKETEDQPHSSKRVCCNLQHSRSPWTWYCFCSWTLPLCQVEWSPIQTCSSKSWAMPSLLLFPGPRVLHGEMGIPEWQRHSYGEWTRVSEENSRQRPTFWWFAWIQDQPWCGCYPYYTCRWVCVLPWR